MLPTQHAYRSALCALRYRATEIEIKIGIAIGIEYQSSPQALASVRPDSSNPLPHPRANHPSPNSGLVRAAPAARD
jgi:hypothetical protein